MNVRVLTVSQMRCLARTADGNRAYAVKAIHSAAPESRPDVICLPEAFTARGVPTRTVADVAESVPGPTTDALAGVARAYACYIVCPIYTSREGRFFNSAVLLDRRGAIVGIYDKARPCLSGDGVFEEGVTAGTGGACFDTDFGRIGLRICMDVNFPEDWCTLSEQRARLVLWPSASDGGLLLRAHAIMNGYFVVSSVRSGKARVVNPCGRVVAETADEAVVATVINLEATVARTDFNPSLADRILERYPARVTVDRYPEEGLLLLEPHDGLTAAELQATLAFERAHESIDRHRRAYAQAAEVRIGSIAATPTA